MTRWARVEMIERGREIVDQFLATTRTGRADLMESGFPEHVAKRKMVILSLHSEGLTRTEMSRVMGLAASTITYWIDPKTRNRRIDARKARYRKVGR